MYSSVDLDILKLVILSWSNKCSINNHSPTAFLTVSEAELQNYIGWRQKAFSAELVAVEMLLYASMLFLPSQQPSKSFSFCSVFGTSAKLSSPPSDSSVTLLLSLKCPHCSTLHTPSLTPFLLCSWLNLKPAFRDNSQQCIKSQYYVAWQSKCLAREVIWVVV